MAGRVSGPTGNLREEAGLALGNLRRWWWRHLLTALVLGVGMAVLLLGLGYISAHGRLLSRGSPQVRLPCRLVMRVPPAVRVMVDPGQPENNIPPTYRYESVFSGDLAAALEKVQVTWMEGAGSVPLFTGPLGQGEAWYVVPEGRLVGALTWRAGRPPRAPGEVALPAEWARQAGVGEGDVVELGTVDPGTGYLRVEAYRVVGVYEGMDPVLAVPLLPLAGERWQGRDFARELKDTGEVAWPYPNILLVDLPQSSTGLFFRILENEEYRMGEILRAGTPGERVSDLTWRMYGPVQSLFPLVFVFAGLGVFASSLLAVLDRRRELAILKAMGIPGAQIGRVLTLEAVAAGLVGSLLGWVGAVLLRPWLVGPGGAPVPISATMVAGAVLAVLVTAGLAAAGPAAMARAATVNELLHGRTIRLWHQRVGERAGERAGASHPGAVASAEGNRPAAGGYGAAGGRGRRVL
ncbi:MAG: FtsX-like permease family protein [Bacillota bacterium]|nr:hypothetical protein [Bacillota bacterium]